MDNTVDVLARTIWGEARNQGLEGLEAVACVVLNRLAVSNAEHGYWWGNTIVQICQKPFQFSCWLNTDPNRRKMLAVTPDNAAFAQCLDVARRAVNGDLPDITGGATHYHTTEIHPGWDKGLLPTVTIGDHIFYRPADVPAINQTEEIT